MSNDVMSAIIPYSGDAPSGSGTAALIDTTTLKLRKRGTVQVADPTQYHGWRYYLLSLKNAAKGTLKLYASSDGGENWHQFGERYVPAATTRRTNDFAFRIDQHQDVKVEWVNGGSAQSTFYVGQALTSEDPGALFAQGEDAFDYIVNGDMESDIAGPWLQVGPLGWLELHIQTTATDSPTGRLSLQCSIDGDTSSPDILTSADAGLPGLGATGALAASDKLCIFTGFTPGSLVRLHWDNTSAGSGTGATLNAQARSR